MAQKSITIKMSEGQMMALRMFFEQSPTMAYYSQRELPLAERVVGLTIAKLYKDKLLKHFVFVEYVTRIKLSAIESAALFCALSTIPFEHATYNGIQLQQLTNLLHQHNQ